MQSSSQAAGIPDRPFPTSLSEQGNQPFAGACVSTVTPPPPGLAAHPSTTPVSIGTPHGSTAHVDNDQNPFFWEIREVDAPDSNTESPRLEIDA